MRASLPRERSVGQRCCLPRVAPTKEVSLHLVDHSIEIRCAEDLSCKCGECKPSQTPELSEATKQVGYGDELVPSICGKTMDANVGVVVGSQRLKPCVWRKGPETLAPSRE